jgi:LEA14-like dessication related protein
MIKYFLALLCIVLLAGCMSYSDVELIDVQGVQVSRFDAGGLAVTVIVKVHNPNDHPIQVKDPDMDLYLNGVSLGKATLDSAIILDRNSTRSYSIPIHATFAQGEAGMLPMLLATALSGSAKLAVKGTVVGKSGLWSKRFPFEVEQQVELRK